MYPHGLSGGARTHGILSPRQALYQLSYTQMLKPRLSNATLLASLYAYEAAF